MALLLLLSLVLTTFQQAPPSAPPSTRGTAILRGQITDAETGLPIPRAAITARLHIPGSQGIVFQNLSDHEGRFELVNLAAGGYQVSATAGEYRASHVREPFPPASPSGSTMSVMLRDGEVRSNINIALRRALAISGRVVDELGDPVVGVSVRLSAARGGPNPYQNPMLTTDDRGMFRLFGIPAGDYVVCIQVYQHPSSRNTAIATPDRFVSTCYPSALKEAEAQVVSVRGADVDGIEIRVRRLRLLSISGIVLDSTGGVAQSASVNFHRYERSGGSTTVTLSAEGQFRFNGLIPGDYAVEAALGGDSSAAAPHVEVKERGYLPVKLAEHDVTDLIVQMTAPATVQGRIVFEDGPPEGTVPPITVAAWPEAGRFHTQIRPARTQDDLSFTLSGLFHRLRLSVGDIPRGWVLKSIRYRGADITRNATEFVTDPRHQIEIALTRRVAVVSGSVTDDSGRPAGSAAVLLLSPEPSERIGGSMTGAPTMGITSRDGRFELRGVAAGDYLIVAIPSAQYDALRQRRATNEVLLKHAERVTLVENDRLTMNLRLVTLPER
jgi:Carboxypeptidase regulatory-like domain